MRLPCSTCTWRSGATRYGGNPRRQSRRLRVRIRSRFNATGLATSKGSATPTGTCMMGRRRTQGGTTDLGRSQTEMVKRIHSNASQPRNDSYRLCQLNNVAIHWHAWVPSPLVRDLRRKFERNLLLPVSEE